MTAKVSLIEAIRQEIVRGNFLPGAHLRLDKLATQFDVSTMPIREALRALEAEGIIYSAPHRGSFVTRFNADELLDIYEMRAVLEQLATRQAVPNFKPHHIQRLQEMVNSWRAESDDIALMVQQNTDFHLLIYELANRPHLYNEIMILRNRTQHYLHAFVAKVGRFERAKQEHQALVDIFASRDADAAAKLMFQHVWHVGLALADYVREQDTD